MRMIAITGASGGLAQAVVKQLPEEDFLILLGRNQERLEKIYGARSNCQCLALDIEDSQAIAQVIDQIYGQHGRLDVLINNAGFGYFRAYDDFTDAEIEQMFRVNSLATMTFSRLVGARMAKAGQGHIVNIASMAGLIASNKSTVYSATKFAVIGFSNALRLELADQGVLVTTVNPGPIKTDFFDQADPSGAYLKSVEKFSLEPDDVARKIVKLLGRNKRELNLPFLLNLTHKVYSLFPKISDYLARTVFNYK